MNGAEAVGLFAEQLRALGYEPTKNEIRHVLLAGVLLGDLHRLIKCEKMSKQRTNPRTGEVSPVRFHWVQLAFTGNCIVVLSDDQTRIHNRVSPYVSVTDISPNRIQVDLEVGNRDARELIGKFWVKTTDFEWLCTETGRSNEIWEFDEPDESFDD